MVQTDDGGFAIVGYTESYGAGDYDFWLVKTDSSGNALWNKTLGGGGSDQASSLIQTNDGGHAITSNNFLLVKTDMNGNMEWNQTYGGAESGYSWCLIETSDGGYAITGGSKPIGADWGDFLLIKTDAGSGLAWADSTADTITLYRGMTDQYWNYVRVLIWKTEENP